MPQPPLRRRLARLPRLSRCVPRAERVPSPLGFVIPSTPLSALAVGIVLVFALCAFAQDAGSVPSDTSIAASESAGPPLVAGFLHARRIVALLVLLVFTGLLFGFIRAARSGRSLFVRRIAGLAAIDEAVGRATEMGRAVLYVPGSQDVTDIQTIYTTVILHSVAKTVASYGTPLIVPVCKAFSYPLFEETVRQGYLDAGHPEAFVPSNVRYLSDEQFAFAAGTDGIMLREKPAANLFLGSFYAESLIMTETGHATGAIQIAGTANIHQLPFFVASCDYTLIGEEFFAATAYISHDARLLGTLKAADVMKALLIAVFLIAAVVMSAGLAPDLPSIFRVE